MRKKLFLTLAATVVASVCAIVIFGFNFDSTPTFKNGTMVGSINLGGLTADQGTTLLDKRFDEPIYFNIESASRSVTPLEIGISYDKNSLLKSTHVCRLKTPQLFCTPLATKGSDRSDVIVIDKEKLDAYLAQLDSAFQFVAQNTIVSFEDYSFRAPAPGTKISVDRQVFASSAGVINLLDYPKIRLKAVAGEDGATATQEQKTLDLIEGISFPLLIKYGGSPVSISKEDIKEFVEIEPRGGFTYGVISVEKVVDYLDELGEAYESEDVKLIETEAAHAIQRALLFRATDYQVNNAVILPIEGRPKTSGEMHDVYLEIVKSQQRLYRFEKGRLVKTYIISTGLTWDTPAGNYSVLGKQKMTISYFGGWYMPNYLPIGTINGYRFGFHEIPYHMDGAGNIYSRDASSMGSPATGGCIQLTKKDSLELFDWAKIGTPVYIYE